MTLSVGGMSDEEKRRIMEQFQSIADETPDDSTTESQPIKRGRGRPKGSRNKPKPADYAPISEDYELPTLATPPLTSRDQREVAKRIAGILEGATGVASVVRPYFQMTDEEAEAIAVPLTTYLIRNESTSGAARQILDEYDVVAFVIALAAYVVRVYLDMRAEREANAESSPSNEQPESASRTFIQQDAFQSQSITGEDGPVSKEYASAIEGSWSPAQL